MPGTVVQTSHDKRGPVGVILLTATADAADGSFPSFTLTTLISGKILALETNPGATAPTTLYDIVLNDDEGHDVLEGVGANRSATATEKVSVVYSGTEIHPEVAKGDGLALVITNNSVNSAVIVVKIYYEGSSS